MAIVGLDLSLTATGLVAVNKTGHILEQVLITSSAKEENTPRLLKISIKIAERVKVIKPELVVLEGPAFGVSKTTSIFQLGELAGLVKTNLFISNIKFMIVAPPSLKKFVTGKGNSKKDLMLLSVYKRFGESFEDDNLCDAFSLAMYGLSTVKPQLMKRGKK